MSAVLTYEIEAGGHRKSAEPDPLGIADAFCAHCLDDWPCVYVEAVAAERARIAEAVAALPWTELEAMDRTAVLRIVRDER